MGNLFPEKKKTRKERTKKQPEYLKTGLCWYDDGSKFKECGRPWSYLCDGNIHKCAHLKQRWFASLSDKNKQYILENTNCYYKVENQRYENKTIKTAS